MIPTLPIQITCPKCGTRYMAQVQSIIDVEQNPQLKPLLLRRQLNTVVCPSCGALGIVSTPLIYHDPQKELLLLFIPPELNLPLAERERLTGNLINALISIVPAEKRKGYFLNPRTMLTMQGLIDEILKADGITPEMLEEQRKRSQLLQDLLTALGNEERLQVLIEQNKDKIDYPFLLMLSAAAEASAAAGQQQVEAKLLELGDTLLARVPVTMPEPLPGDLPTGEIVDRMVGAKDKPTRWAMVLYNRPLLDYPFFQELTRRIEQSPPEEAESLRELRTELLEMVEQLDKEAQAVQEAKMKLLQEALDSSNPEQILRQRKQEIDTFFLAILNSALRHAEKSGEKEKVQELVAINETVMSILQEDLPAELRLVNELLATEYPQGTQQLLQGRRRDWSADLLQVLEMLATDLARQGRPETAQRLREIRTQAEAILRDSSGPASRPEASASASA